MADWQATGGPRYYRSPMLADLPEVVHGFFTRQGGASLGAYHSLNVSLAVGDGQEAVAENLGRMRQALGLSELAGAAQVHGGRAAVITSPDQARLATSRRWTSWSPPSPVWACLSSRRTARR